MGLLILLQVILDLAFIATATWLLIERSKDKTMEDPRFSKGLQLLSSKIAILQDLMDRSDVTSRQLTQLVDGKQQDIQERMEEMEVYLHKIQRMAENSGESAANYQPRAPRQDTVERQNTMKYMQAAKLAHQGYTVEDIAKQLDIPRGELELIVKVNRDRLVGAPEETAEEIAGMTSGATAAETTRAANQAGSGQTVSGPDSWTMKTAMVESTVMVGQTAATANAAQTAHAAPAAQATQVAQVAPAAQVAQAAQAIAQANTTTPDGKSVRPVVFRRISAVDNLG